jgi:abortive infection bacteriophage resistance protein
MQTTNQPPPRRFGLAEKWLKLIINCITARSSTSKDARAGLSFSGQAAYRKPHLTFEQQVWHLRQKGMVIEDEALALSTLAQIGYYRLSAYWHPFKERDAANKSGNEALRAGTRFQFAHDLYEFDRQLRQLVLEGVEIIEVSLRVDIAYLLGQLDPFAYMRVDLLSAAFSKPDINGETDYSKWHQGYQDKLHRPNEDFTKHLIGKYGHPLPIWASIELWEFNQLCFFLGGMRREHTLKIAHKYGLSCPKMFLSWVKAIKGIRNHAAHHGRIWNRNMAAQPSLPAKSMFSELDFIVSDATKIRQARACCPLLLMAHLIRKADPASAWPDKLRTIIAQFPIHTGLTIEAMGFPSWWPNRPID